MGLDVPDLDGYTKEELYAWSREHFPELALNVQWMRERLVHTIRLYVDAPLVKYMGT